MNIGTMFNTYPDSIGDNLNDIVVFLSKPELKNSFKSFYILPTVFNSDLDRGFSIVSYDLSKELATKDDLKKLLSIGIDLTFDFILNHLSVMSPQFQDILKNGDDSKYRDFFIDWNNFWKNKGEMTSEGYIKPYPDQFNYNNLRKNGLPILTVKFPDGKNVPYWNTFYQKIIYPNITSNILESIFNKKIDKGEILANTINKQLSDGKKPIELEFNNVLDKETIINYLEENKTYLGQMDLNFNNPEVWKWYEDIINQLSNYGASIIRLDSFSRLHKEPKRTNFVNEPETWEILERLKKIAKENGVNVLPEIHASYSKQYYKKLSSLGCMTYDYFLPGLIIDAIDTKESKYLYLWASEIIKDKINVVNMLGCHDGIPMRDVRGLLPNERVDNMIERLIQRGGHKKIVHGEKDEIYQMDMTYFSALDCNERKMELARAIQLFMPGKPQIWYMDLFAEPSDENILKTVPNTDTREVNRRRYSVEETDNILKRKIVQKQLELLKFRNTNPVFNKDAKITIEKPTDYSLIIKWEYNLKNSSLYIDLNNCNYKIENN